MHSLLNAASRDAIRERAARLQPDAPARWGRFTAPQMLSHAIQSLRMMTGELAVAGAPVPWVVRHAPLRHLLIYVLPFPKGLPTSPELLARPAADPASMSPARWADEQQELARALERIEARASATDWPAHPAFGAMTGRDWGVLQDRHLAHHFAQFGV